MFKTGQVQVETLLQGTVTVQGTTTELSDYQTDINTKKDALDAAIKGIEVPADYTAYDAFVVVLVPRIRTPLRTNIWRRTAIRTVR